MLKSRFWQRAAESLPAAVRERHAAELERAERCDLFVSAVVDAWRAARAWLASGRRLQRA